MSFTLLGCLWRTAFPGCDRFLGIRMFISLEPEYDKTYDKTCVASKGSDQPVHPPSMARVLVYPSG